MKLKLYPDSIVYIVCPRKVRTGGTELLHQLASHLLRRGVRAEMVYANPIDFRPDDTFAEYHVPATRSVINNEKNILIMSEGWLYFDLYWFASSKMRKVAWWLSVDNYVHSLKNIWASYYTDVSFGKREIPHLFYFQKDENITHWIQSYYAAEYLVINGVEEFSYVSDYLNPVFLQRAKEVTPGDKEPYIAYNPSKGLEFTQKLMAAAPDLDWRPIQNMTPKEVEAFLRRAMVYIDFGNHPGKDRIPREAAISGCAVITGMRGAAGNDYDVPIPKEYKFQDEDASIPRILAKIREILGDFPTAYEKFAVYRKIIMGEPEEFRRDVDEALGLKPDATTTPVALLQEEPGRSACLDLLKTLPHLRPVYAVSDSASKIPGGGVYLSYPRRMQHFSTQKAA